MKNPVLKDVNDTFSPFVYQSKGEKKYIVPGVSSSTKDFLNVLQERVSSLNFQPHETSTIENLLFISNKIKSVQIDGSGYIITKRTVPSAGGRHPIDLLISFPTSRNSLTYYNPLDQSLSSLILDKTSLSNFISDIETCVAIKNATIIWFSIQHEKTASKYTNPESLYWRDCGALLYCLQLVSGFLGLNSCPVGHLANDTFNRLFQTDKLISGGGILVG